MYCIYALYCTLAKECKEGVILEGQFESIICQLKNSLLMFETFLESSTLIKWINKQLLF